MSRMITPESLCSHPTSLTPESVSALLSVSPVSQHWRQHTNTGACVCSYSHQVSPLHNMQQVLLISRPDISFICGCSSSIVVVKVWPFLLSAVCRPAQESAAPWWAADPEQRQCVGAVVTSGHQWSHQHCHEKLRTRAPQVSDRSQGSQSGKQVFMCHDMQVRLVNEKVSVEIRSWPLLPRDDTRKRWPRSRSEKMTASPRQKLSQSLQSFAASSLASNLASLALWSSVDPASISSVVLFPLLHLGRQPTQLNT